MILYTTLSSKAMNLSARINNIWSTMPRHYFFTFGAHCLIFSTIITLSTKIIIPTTAAAKSTTMNSKAMVPFLDFSSFHWLFLL